MQSYIKKTKSAVVNKYTVNTPRPINLYSRLMHGRERATLLSYWAYIICSPTSNTESSFISPTYLNSLAV